MTPYDITPIAGTLTAVAMLYFIALWLSKPRRTREDVMAKDFRNTRVRFFVGEGITNFVEDGVADRKITRVESIDIYTKIGKAFGLDDLLPKKKLKTKLSYGEQQHLKEKIKERSPHLVDKLNGGSNVVVMPSKRRVIGA